jgi:hypothetical protein
MDERLARDCYLVNVEKYGVIRNLRYWLRGSLEGDYYQIARCFALVLVSRRPM